MVETIRKGVISSLVFYSDRDGYTVAKVSGTDEEFTVVGYIPGVRAGTSYEFTGGPIVHPKYGEQFSITSYTETEPDTNEGIELFLASGAVKGLGPKMAQAIVGKFGERTLEIIENSPELLTTVSGIGKKKAESIRESFAEQKEFAEIVLYFRQFGISPAAIMKLYKEYGSDAIDAVKENPYRMIEDIYGVGFKAADSIAQKMGTSANSAFRIQSGILFVLGRYSADGNTYVPKNELLDRSVELMDVTRDDVEEEMFALTLDGKIEQKQIDGVDAVFSSGLFFAETAVCRELGRLTEAIPKEITADADNLIRMTERDIAKTLSEIQKMAVKKSLDGGVFMITGGPGTGKTTIINAIMDIFEHCGFETAIAAPTGRAAKRITEATGYSASTIHRLLEYSFTEDGEEMRFGKNRENPLEKDAVIVDEASMIDVMLMKALLEAIPSGTRLIVVGDADQLPPVGPGNVLGDILKSGVVPSAHLDEIFRQAEESMIIVNAHRINSGEYPYVNERDSDFFLERRERDTDILESVLSLCTKRLPGRPGAENKNDIQVLTPVKKGMLGSINLNRELQKCLNPPSPDREEKIFGDRVYRVGDKVMQIKNNYNLTWIDRKDFSSDTGVFNGDKGIIDSIDNDFGELTVIYDETRYVKYDFMEIDQLDHAYAITVHKSQGSEFGTVVIPLFPFAPSLATRNLIYTAVTRGKELVVLTGREYVLKAMVDNDHNRERYSALANMLVAYENNKDSMQ